MNFFSEKLRNIEEICLVCRRLFICYREAGSAGERSSNGRTGFTVVESSANNRASFFGRSWLDNIVKSLPATHYWERHQSQLTKQSNETMRCAHRSLPFIVM
jgi:hypothetical protein